MFGGCLGSLFLFCILVDDFAAVASTKDVTLPHMTSRRFMI